MSGTTGVGTEIATSEIEDTAGEMTATEILIDGTETGGTMTADEEDVMKT